MWKGSLTGKAVVPKTTARCRLQVQVLPGSPYRRSPTGMRRLAVPANFGRMLNVTTSPNGPTSRSFTCRPSLWVVAQSAEHRTVTAAREGSTPFDPPKFSRPPRPCGSDVAGNMRVFQTRLESSNLSFRSKCARVAKRLRRRIANPVFVSSSLTACSNPTQSVFIRG